MTRYLSMREVATMLDVTELSVRRYIASGKLRAVRVGPRKIRITLDAVEAFLQPVTVTEAS